MKEERIRVGSRERNDVGSERNKAGEGAVRKE